MPASGPSTPILFLHGCWHGSWCRAEVRVQVTGVGARGLAPRLPPAAGAGRGVCPPDHRVATPTEAGDRANEVEESGRRFWQVNLVLRQAPKAL